MNINHILIIIHRGIIIHTDLVSFPQSSKFDLGRLIKKTAQIYSFQKKKKLKPLLLENLIVCEGGGGVFLFFFIKFERSL